MTDTTEIEQPVSSTMLDAWRIESDVPREETSLSEGWERSALVSPARCPWSTARPLSCRSGWALR